MKKTSILSLVVLLNFSAVNSWPGWLWSSADASPVKNNQALGDELAESLRHRSAVVKKAELPDNVEEKLKEVDVKKWRDDSGLSLLDIAVMNGFIDNPIRNAGGQLTEAGLDMLVSQMAAKAFVNCLSETERNEYERLISFYTKDGVMLAPDSFGAQHLQKDLMPYAIERCNQRQSQFAGQKCRNKKILEYLIATTVAKNK